MNQPSPRSDDASWRCANCSSPLADAYAVCTRCEPEFATAPQLEQHRDPTRLQLTAFHHCSVCNVGFDVPATCLAPQVAPWWRPQTMAWCCPQCCEQLDFVPGPTLKNAYQWGSIGRTLGIVVAVNSANSPWSGWQLGFSMAIAGYAAMLLSVYSLFREINPQFRSQRPEPSAPAAATLRQGRFVLHGALRSTSWRSRFSSWLRNMWLARVNLWPLQLTWLLALAIWIAGTVWWPKQSHLPGHEEGPWFMRAALLIISYASLWYALRLKRAAVDFPSPIVASATQSANPDES